MLQDIDTKSMAATQAHDGRGKSNKLTASVKFPWSAKTVAGNEGCWRSHCQCGGVRECIQNVRLALTPGTWQLGSLCVWGHSVGATGCQVARCAVAKPKRMTWEANCYCWSISQNSAGRPLTITPPPPLLPPPQFSQLVVLRDVCMTGLLKIASVVPWVYWFLSQWAPPNPVTGPNRIYISSLKNLTHWGLRLDMRLYWLPHPATWWRESCVNLQCFPSLLWRLLPLFRSSLTNQCIHWLAILVRQVFHLSFVYPFTTISPLHWFHH